MKDSKYLLFLFPLVLEGINKEFSSNQKFWIKASPSESFIHFNKLNELSQESKKVFVYNLLLIHGLINSTKFSSVEFKKQGARFVQNFDFSINFKTDKEKGEYIKFRNLLIEQ